MYGYMSFISGRYILHTYKDCPALDYCIEAQVHHRSFWSLRYRTVIPESGRLVGISVSH
jgi:hypothetical protein